jgi:hypothetical protein
MTNQRIIWRPNEIPLEQWEAMSRADQIQWWKDRQGPPDPRPQMKKAIRLYHRGIITQHEFPQFVAKWATPDEIESFVRDCPAELLARLHEELDHYGPDETRWPRTFHSGCYAPWVTPEEIKEAQRQEQESIWNGMRLLKAYFSRGRSES